MDPSCARGIGDDVVMPQASLGSNACYAQTPSFLALLASVAPEAPSTEYRSVSVFFLVSPLLSFMERR